jgi:ABC-type antimicrobial peptide transport system permease subunit
MTPRQLVLLAVISCATCWGAVLLAWLGGAIYYETQAPGERTRARWSGSSAGTGAVIVAVISLAAPPRTTSVLSSWPKRSCSPWPAGRPGWRPGAAATAIYAHVKGWATVIPPVAWAGGLGAALVIGAAAGLLPALRAARMSPTRALWAI